MKNPIDESRREFLINLEPEQMWRMTSEQICKYILVKDEEPHLLGSCCMPPDMDFDDAFPIFHRNFYDDDDRLELASEIAEGASLVAVCESKATGILLAYTLGEPSFWHAH